MFTHHTFISHRSLNHDYAYELRNALESHGIATWIDDVNLGDSENWHSKIYDAIESARSMVGIVTPEALESHFVRGEWDLAVVCRVTCYLAIYEPCELPKKYVALKTFDLTKSNREEQLWELIESIRQSEQNSYPSDTLSDYIYLRTLYFALSQELHRTLVSSLATYGRHGNRVAEPLNIPINVQRPITGLTYKSGALLELADIAESFLLLGAAGSGKSTLLINAVRDAIINRLLNSSLPTPVLIDLSVLPGGTRHKLTEAISGSEILELCGVPNSVIELHSSGKVTLFVDNIQYLSLPRLVAIAELIPIRIATARIETFDPETAHVRPSNGMDKKLKEHFLGIGTVEDISDISFIRQLLYGAPELLPYINIKDDLLLELFGSPLMLTFLAYVLGTKVSQDELDIIRTCKSRAKLRATLIGIIVTSEIEQAFSTVPHLTGVEGAMERYFQCLYAIAKDRAYECDIEILSLLHSGSRMLIRSYITDGVQFSHALFAEYFILSHLVGRTSTKNNDQNQYSGYTLVYTFDYEIMTSLSLTPWETEYDYNISRSIISEVRGEITNVSGMSLTPPKNSRKQSVPEYNFTLLPGYAERFPGFTVLHSVSIDPWARTVRETTVRELLQPGLLVAENQLVCQVNGGGKPDIESIAKVLYALSINHIGWRQKRAYGAIRVEVTSVSINFGAKTLLSLHPSEIFPDTSSLLHALNAMNDDVKAGDS